MRGTGKRPSDEVLIELGETVLALAGSVEWTGDEGTFLHLASVRVPVSPKTCEAWLEYTGWQLLDGRGWVKVTP